MITVAVEDTKEQAGKEAIGARPEEGGIADDGAPPWHAGGGAAYDGGGF
jgi:hypothetical protein